MQFLRRRREKSEAELAREAEDQRILDTTAFTAEELAALRQRWEGPLGGGRDGGTVRIERLLEELDLALFPLARRSLQVCSRDASGDISFPEYAAAMNAMGGKVGPEEKFRFAFRLFDLDNDGLIDVTDMFDLCRTLTPPGLTEAQLLDIVEEYLARFPTGVNYEIFTQMIDVADLAKFTLNSV